MSKSWTPPSNNEDAAEFERQHSETRPGSFFSHFKSRFSAEPLVPIGKNCNFIFVLLTVHHHSVIVGVLVTVGALASGIVQFASSKPDPRKSQMLMRGRIYAQGFTVAAFLGYAAFSSIEIKPKSRPE